MVEPVERPIANDDDSNSAGIIIIMARQDGTARYGTGVARGTMTLGRGRKRKSQGFSPEKEGNYVVSGGSIVRVKPCRLQTIQKRNTNSLM